MKKLNIIFLSALFTTISLFFACEKEEPISEQTEDIVIKKPSKILINEAGDSYMTYGPVGGGGGEDFIAAMPRDSDEMWNKIKKIQVWNGGWIDAIQIEWVNNRGEFHHSEKYGDNTYCELEEFSLESNEYITKVKVSYGIFVNGIKFYTNLRESRTYGHMKTNMFIDEIVTFDFLNYGQVCQGIFGRSGLYLDQIGFCAYDTTLFGGTLNIPSE